MVAAIERLLPEAQVIVVSDTAIAENHRFRVVPKWSPFDRLGLEIEVAAQCRQPPRHGRPILTQARRGLYLRATPT